MKIEIPAANSHIALAEAVKNAASGDIIVVHTEAMKELGQRAQARMCPDKQMTFEIKEVE